MFRKILLLYLHSRTKSYFTLRSETKFVRVLIRPKHATHPTHLKHHLKRNDQIPDI